MPLVASIRLSVPLSVCALTAEPSVTRGRIRIIARMRSISVLIIREEPVEKGRSEKNEGVEKN